MTIREIIQQVVKETIDVDFGIPCKVIGYDSDDQTIDCSPIAEGADFLNVKLQAEQSSGALLIPKKGSVVIIQQTSSASAYVSLFGELDEIVFFDGDNGGLVKVSELVEKLNNLENWINTFKATFDLHVHSGVTTGAGSSAVSPTPSPNTLTPTTEQELEDENITH